ncbi:hypothetical protein [Thalassotalea castellviae]|uniref:Uncharacterized protein n=1 Tax=Thalassotalea castellviae TaxID=3075612 RepID=A0ABU2ZXE9_9GAMM|nr:hypothetical protein [Thalassotalea sp. W431]MDT0602584.1 hypothetical protein [Thalassotalea sp. W431]
MWHLFFKCLFLTFGLLSSNALLAVPLIDSSPSSSSFEVLTDRSKSTLTELSLNKLSKQNSRLAISFKNLIFEPRSIVNSNFTYHDLTDIPQSVTQKRLNLLTEIHLTFQFQIMKEIEFAFLSLHVLINRLHQTPFNSI